MPVKTHRQNSSDHSPARSRSHSIRTIASKSAAFTTKRTSGAGSGIRRNRSKTNNIETKSNVEPTANSNDEIQQEFDFPKLVKRIAEVTDKNIDEVLKLPDLSLLPQAFLTEIEHDEVYATILQELQKKQANVIATKTTPGSDEDHHQSSTAPYFTVDDGDPIDTIEEMSGIVFDDHSRGQEKDGYDTDIEIEPDEHETAKVPDKDKYRELCADSKIVPCSYFMAHIKDDKMLLRYHQFNTADIQAITKTLITNYTIEQLSLDGNFLQREAAKYITQLIAVNEFITELSLVDNRLGGGEGTKEICRMLTTSQNLRKINLSGNKFDELDVTHLIEAFEHNTALRELDLSHNCFGEKCGQELGAFISANDSLESLNLGWNNFRGESAIAMIDGIRENTRLRRCNLEMNGFGPDGGPPLAECIKKNTVLEELNISGNRLNTQNAFAIGQALSVNDTLQVLRIAGNQINSDGALAVFLCIKASETSRMREVDFSRTVVTQESIDVCEDIVKLKNGDFQYRVGKVTPKMLQSNATSICYVKTNETLLKKLRANAKKRMPNEN
ncbi:unnamed protein product [Adineta ricciae]|uniref:Uncharacterized protein n=1 Tax=Adineta ricciae TaxID=249248 RepID=A0A813S5J0_ADIRI|nr:unnamed protein product [Adineta ricciae]CAF0912935.1 unnamed protein product [Adineta ricciae]